MQTAVPYALIKQNLIHCNCLTSIFQNVMADGIERWPINRARSLRATFRSATKLSWLYNQPRETVISTDDHTLRHEAWIFRCIMSLRWMKELRFRRGLRAKRHTFEVITRQAVIDLGPR